MQEKNQWAGLPWLGPALCPTTPEKRSSAVF